MEIPQEPEAPEGVKWVRWIAHELFREGAVIRKAPLATIIMAGAMFLLARWVVETEVEGKISGLQGVIETKNAEVQFLDEKLQSYEVKAPPNAATTTRARMKVMTVGRYAEGKDGLYSWGVYMQNVGTGIATEMIHAQGAKITPTALSPRELDAWFAQLFKQLTPRQKNPKSLPTAEFQPNDLVSFSGKADFPGKRVDAEVVKGTNYLYNVAVILYRDTDTPPGKWRITEQCDFTTGTAVQTTCDTHNRLYLSD